MVVVVVEGGITVVNTTTNQNTRHVNVALARRSIYTLNYRGRRYTLTCTEVVLPLIAAGRGERVVTPLLACTEVVIPLQSWGKGSLTLVSDQKREYHTYLDSTSQPLIIFAEPHIPTS